MIFVVLFDAIVSFFVILIDSDSLLWWVLRVICQVQEKLAELRSRNFRVSYKLDVVFNSLPEHLAKIVSKSFNVNLGTMVPL